MGACTGAERHPGTVAILFSCSFKSMQKLNRCVHITSNLGVRQISLAMNEMECVASFLRMLHVPFDSLRDTTNALEERTVYGSRNQ